MRTFQILRLSLLETAAPPIDRRGEPPFLIVGLGANLGDLDRPPVAVDRDEREVTGVRMATPAGDQLLGFNAYADFH